MTDTYPQNHPTEVKNLNSLRILSAIGVIVGCWSLLFEIYFFKGFILEIYFARLIFTFIALSIFGLSFRNNSQKFITILTHIFLISLISSFIITIYKIPRTVFINSQILSLLIFTTAIIFSWETRNQIIVAIYYNILFAASIIFNNSNIYLLPNLFSLVIFVCLISFLSVAASFITYNLRNKLLLEQKNKEEAISLLLKETTEKERTAQKLLSEKKQKIEVLAKINHEVRTPISSIVMYFEMLDDGSLRSPEEIKNYSQSVKTSLQRLLNTIDNFVDYAKIETGKIEVEYDLFNLNEEVENSIQLLMPLAHVKNNELIMTNNNHSQILVYSDAVKYRQILINIIANALKFTDNGKISVVFENKMISEDEYEVITSVEDTGPGIPEGRLGSIFDSFVSLRDADKSNHSSGLGLTICREFVNMLGGDINVESTLGKGTKFTIRIPYKYDYTRVNLPVKS